MTPHVLTRTGWSSSKVASTYCKRPHILITPSSTNGCRDNKLDCWWTGWPLSNAFNSSQKNFFCTSLRMIDLAPRNSSKVSSVWMFFVDLRQRNIHPTLLKVRRYLLVRWRSTMSSKCSGFGLSVIAIIPIVTFMSFLGCFDHSLSGPFNSTGHSTKSYGPTTVTLLFLEWVSRQVFHLLGPKTTQHLPL